MLLLGTLFHKLFSSKLHAYTRDTIGQLYTCITYAEEVKFACR